MYIVLLLSLVVIIKATDEVRFTHYDRQDCVLGVDKEKIEFPKSTNNSFYVTSISVGVGFKAKPVPSALVGDTEYFFGCFDADYIAGSSFRYTVQITAGSSHAEFLPCTLGGTSFLKPIGENKVILDNSTENSVPLGLSTSNPSPTKTVSGAVTTFVYAFDDGLFNLPFDVILNPAGASMAGLCLCVQTPTISNSISLTSVTTHISNITCIDKTNRPLKSDTTKVRASSFDKNVLVFAGALLGGALLLGFFAHMWGPKAGRTSVNLSA